MSKRQKCPECKGKTQCDCHLCWGRGYLKPKAEGSRLQPQQPDDQYPGVPVQGWTPPPEEQQPPEIWTDPIGSQWQRILPCDFDYHKHGDVVVNLRPTGEKLPHRQRGESYESFFSRKVKDMIVQASLDINADGLCSFKPEDVANIRLLVGLLETDRYHLIKDVERLEREIERLRNSK